MITLIETDFDLCFDIINWLPVHDRIFRKLPFVVYRSVHKKTCHCVYLTSFRHVLHLFFSDRRERHFLVFMGSWAEEQSDVVSEPSDIIIVPSQWNVLPSSIRETDYIHCSRSAVKTLL